LESKYVRAKVLQEEQGRYRGAESAAPPQKLRASGITATGAKAREFGHLDAALKPRSSTVAQVLTVEQAFMGGAGEAER
jgi:hypothetical protein